MSERQESTDDQTHSPGPWTIDWNLAGGGQHEDFPQLFFAGIKSAGEPDELSLHLSGWWRKPDTYLIAAAPDLLAALKDLYALVQGECPSLLENDHHDVMVAQAIAKAEGRS